MAQFTLTITAIGPNGCDRKAQPGDKLHGRCSKLTCPDCLTYDYMLLLRQKGMAIGDATFTHQPGTDREVVDDMVLNERTKGSF